MVAWIRDGGFQGARGPAWDNPAIFPPALLIECSPDALVIGTPRAARLRSRGLEGGVSFQGRTTAGCVATGDMHGKGDAVILASETPMHLNARRLFGQDGGIAAWIHGTSDQGALVPA